MFSIQNIQMIVVVAVVYVVVVVVVSMMGYSISLISHIFQRCSYTSLIQRKVSLFVVKNSFTIDDLKYN